MTGRAALALILLPCLLFQAALADFTFEDTEFVGRFTTEALDAIIEKYELHDGWYWTAPTGVPQDYHGHEGRPGWTHTTVVENKKRKYEKGWYGCRFGTDVIDAAQPNARGWGECFGFAMFIGYLLSGDKNPMSGWNIYYSVARAHGLRVGDIIRMEYEHDGKSIAHSVVVYSVDGDECLFLQASGGTYNLLRTRRPYNDGYMRKVTSQRVFRKLKGIRIFRSPLNDP